MQVIIKATTGALEPDSRSWKASQCLNQIRPPSAPSCLSPGWNKHVDYEPGTGSKQLFPKMHLETCGGPLSSARTTVELQTSHIGKGCDRETYSEKSLQKLCGWWPQLFLF